MISLSSPESVFNIIQMVLMAWHRRRHTEWRMVYENMVEFQRHRPLHQLRVCVLCAFSTCRALLSTNCWRLFQAAHVHMPSTESIWTHSRTHKFKAANTSTMATMENNVNGVQFTACFHVSIISSNVHSNTAISIHGIAANVENVERDETIHEPNACRHVEQHENQINIEPHEPLDTHIKCNHL